MRRPIALGLLVGAVLAAAAGNVPAAEEASPAAIEKVRQSNSACLACHSEAGLKSLPTGVTFDIGKARRFQVDPQAFERSNHGQVECVACHVTGFTEYPHAEKAREQINWCDECHTRAFLVIEEQFLASVHARKFKDSFTCVTCHDPHVFVKADHFSTAREAVRQDNAMCLNCHSSDENFARISKEGRPQIDAIHDWLPNTELHWSAVRCVECHTPVAKKYLSHEIVDAEKAERQCVSCHTTNSELRVRLYRHLVAEERNRVGFVNSAILNESYIVGATRNETLDWLSFIILGLVVLGLAGHTLARVLGWLWRR